MYSWLHLCVVNEHLLRGLRRLCLASDTCTTPQASSTATLGQGKMAAIILPTLTQCSFGCPVTDNQGLPALDCATCDAGQGLALAIEDAVVLAWHLRREGLTEKALRRSCLSVHALPCHAVLCSTPSSQVGPCPVCTVLPLLWMCPACDISGYTSETISACSTWLSCVLCVYDHTKPSHSAVWHCLFLYLSHAATLSRTSPASCIVTVS